MLTLPSEINICVYGLNPCRIKTWGLIDDNLLDPIRALSVRTNIYCCTVDPSGAPSMAGSRLSNSDAETNEVVNFEPGVVARIDQSTIDAVVDWKSILSLENLDAADHAASADQYEDSMRDIIISLHALDRCYRLIPKSKTQFPVIFLRTDIEILSMMPVQCLLISMSMSQGKNNACLHEKSVAIVPLGDDSDGVNESFAICTAGHSAETYASRVRLIGSYLNLSSHPFRPGSYLNHILSMRHVHVLPIIDTPMVRMPPCDDVRRDYFDNGSAPYSVKSESWRSLVRMNQRVISDLLKSEARLRSLLSSVDEQPSQIVSLQKELRDSTDEQQRLAEQNEQLKRELQESTEDAELTLLQLHQVQEELERYFLKSNQLNLQLKEREDSVRELGLQLKQQRQDAARDTELQVKQLREDYESQLARNNTTLTSLVTQRDRLLSTVRSQSRLIHRFMAVCSRILPSFLVSSRTASGTRYRSE